MTDGVLETKNTRLYFRYSDSEIHKVACATGITGLGGAGDQIDTTCLDSDEREYVRGMLNPGPLSVPINFIPLSAAHQRLTELRETGERVSWMIVLSDQAGAPVTVDTDNRLIAPGPTSVEFIGYVSDMNIDIATNEIVRATLTIQRSGGVNWTFANPAYA